MRDRINSICEILLAAAYADDFFHEKEGQVIGELLRKVMDDDVPAEVKELIGSFDPKSFDLASRVAEFADDTEDDKYKLLEFIAAVHEADDEFDFAEDEFVREVASGLGFEGEKLARFTLEFEVEDLKEDLEQLRTGPPPPPGASE
jgi:uncharacterized tellurite resistance protein B-like protein